MSAQREEHELDQALARARTPQVPADLAARIVNQVTQLPQQAPAAGPASSPVAEKPAGWRWQRTAAVAALFVLAGAAAFLFRGAPDGERASEQLVAAQPAGFTVPAPGPAADRIEPQAAELAATSTGTSAPAGHPADLPQDLAATQEPAPVAQPLPPAVELAESPAAAPPGTEPAPVLAQGDPSPPSVNIGPTAPVGPSYGPSEAPQGLGIVGGNRGGIPGPGPSAPTPRAGPAGMRPPH